ncbi:MAG: hypothetical protein PHQ52_07140 [Candidatus Omnitrophica bacterium]|nr:hypothetical protein [Candidatus Omnitrophota bacterium]
MKKSFKRKSFVRKTQDETSEDSIFDKFQKQLNEIEKKLDILISQDPKRPTDNSYSQRTSRGSNNYQSHDRTRPGTGFMERTYTRATCSECKKECEIPFKPSSGRPVYCSECFEKIKRGNGFNSSRDTRSEERDLSRERYTDKRQRPGKNKSFSFVGRKKRA